MIEGGLEFDCEAGPVATALAALPQKLRPVYFSHGERVRNKADRVDDHERFAAFLKISQSGFFLKGPKII